MTSALVFLPGLDGFGAAISGFTAALSPEVELIRVGYPPDQPLDYAALEGAARSSLPLGRPFYLLGESFSGPIAISIAASHPPGLKGLILCCSFARNPYPFLAWMRPALALLPLMRPALRLSRLVYGADISQELAGELSAAQDAVSTGALRARLEAVLACDVSAKLPGLSIPILYFRASRDHILPSSAAEKILSAAPHTVIRDFDAPHFLLQAKPVEAAQAVKEFIAAALQR